MRTSEQINEIATALAKAQGAMEGAVKGNINPHFKSKYADLGAVWDACREQLTKNGISVIQPVVATGTGGAHVTITRLMHTSGQWIEDGGIPLILSKEDMQGLGSALTYSRRYGLMAMVGIAPEDDDGNAASQQPSSRPVAVPVKPEGYADWRLNLTATADTGRDSLNAMWSTSKTEYRDYLRQSEPDAMAKLRERAQKAEKVHA